MKEIEPIFRSSDLSTFHHVFIHQIFVGYCNCVPRRSCTRITWEGSTPQRNWFSNSGRGLGNLYLTALWVIWCKTSIDHFVKHLAWSPTWINSTLPSGTLKSKGFRHSIVTQHGQRNTRSFGGSERGKDTRSRVLEEYCQKREEGRTFWEGGQPLQSSNREKTWTAREEWAVWGDGEMRDTLGLG